MHTGRIGREVSGLLLFASTLLHLYTFVPGARASSLLSALLAVCASIWLGVMTRGIRHERAAMARDPKIATDAKWRRDLARREFNRRAVAATPLPLRVLVGLALAYVVFNLSTVPWGTVDVSDDGAYVLRYRGHVVRKFTAPQYTHFRNLKERRLTSFLVLFSLLPAVFYTRVWPALHPEEEE